MAASNEIELMSTVFDLLGTNGLAPSPTRDIQAQHTQLEDAAAPLPSSSIPDRDLEKWVLGSQADTTDATASELEFDGAPHYHQPAPAPNQFHSTQGSQYHQSQHPHHSEDRFAAAGAGSGARATDPALLGPSRHAEELSVALVEAQMRNAQSDTIIAEHEAVLRKVRSVQITRLQEAIALLEEEETLRKKRCVAITEQLRALDAKKEHVIVGYADAGSDVLSTGDSAGVVGVPGGARRQAPEVVFSYDFTRSMHRGQAAAAHRKRKSGEHSSPTAIPVACGPLTKKDVDSHFNRYWESQRFRRMMSAQDRVN